MLCVRRCRGCRPRTRDGGLGQESQVLGPTLVEPHSYAGLPGTRIRARRAAETHGHRHGGQIHQHRRPEQPAEILQDDAEPAQVADEVCYVLHGRHGLRHREHRGAVRDPVRGRQGLIVSDQIYFMC